MQRTARLGQLRPDLHLQQASVRQTQMLLVLMRLPLFPPQSFVAQRLEAGYDPAYLRQLFDFLTHVVASLEAPARSEATRQVCSCDCRYRYTQTPTVDMHMHHRCASRARYHLRLVLLAWRGMGVCACRPGALGTAKLASATAKQFCQNLLATPRCELSDGAQGYAAIKEQFSTAVAAQNAALLRARAGAAPPPTGDGQRCCFCWVRQPAAVTPP